MEILRIIARLLDYPEQALLDHQAEILEGIRTTRYLPPDLRRNIMAEVKRAQSLDLYDQQARYDALFDRGRRHSLLLFEHIHGESRERGQAMVDLLAIYDQAGFTLASHHLPDYLPLFLEFLSTQEVETAADWLANIAHILLLLAERLRQDGAWEAILLDSLLLISGQPLADDRITAQVEAEEDDRTPSALDKAWEDKEIRFDEPAGEADGCPMTANDHTIQRQPPQILEANEQPVHWHKPIKRKKVEASS